MRLWHYELIPVLPKEMLVSQWRECIAIKRQWEKETLKHRLVSYVTEYNKTRFYWYVCKVVTELNNRNINFQRKFFDEIQEFCLNEDLNDMNNYPEHNDRYLKQCYYNLQEKNDRGIISEEEWKPIDKFWQHVIASENDE